MNTPTITSSIGTLRKATQKEVAQAAQQAEDVQEWQEVMDFVHALYGDKVYKAQLEIDHNFDDGEENRHLTMIHAFDKEENQLPFDLTLPFWQQKYYTGKTYLEEIQIHWESEIEQVKKYQRKNKLSEEERKAAYAEAVRQVVSDDKPEIADLDFYHNEYYVDEPPLKEGETPITLYIQA